MHCWHQAVRVVRAGPQDQAGDISVDTSKARKVYAEWLAMTRPAGWSSPEGKRRPTWLMRPLKPTPETFLVRRS
jgi:hypothetical protein